MTKDEIFALADRTYDRVLRRPGDPNAKFIAGVKGDSVVPNDSKEKIIDRFADQNAKRRAQEGMEAASFIHPLS